MDYWQIHTHVNLIIKCNIMLLTLMEKRNRKVKKYQNFWRKINIECRFYTWLRCFSTMSILYSHLYQMLANICCKNCCTIGVEILVFIITSYAATTISVAHYWFLDLQKAIARVKHPFSEKSPIKNCVFRIHL